MVSELSISGYKSLRDARLSTTALNVLVGANACGKSSLLQTLLLLRQSAQGKASVSVLQLSGLLFEAGTARDVLHPEARAGMRIAIRSDERLSESLFAHDSAEGPDVRRLSAATPLELPANLFDDSSDGFAYLNAERIGPRVAYQLPTPGHILSGPCGMHGEFTAAFLTRCQQANESPHLDWFALLEAVAAVMPEDLLLDSESKRNLQRLDLVAKQILAWVMPGIDFQTSEQSITDSAQLSYIRDPSGTKTLVRPTHMGFGVTYTLPVIAAALALRPGSLFLVENPEAHLHPSSQSRIGTFLAVSASRGPQIFVETHSDHVVNGIRLAAKSGLIDYRNVKFFYFRRLPHEDSSSVTELTMSPDGGLSAWPEGFFDQIERDLSRL